MTKGKLENNENGGRIMRTYDEDLQAALLYHGHLCQGLCQGVRMARYGLSLLNIEDPFTFRDLIVFVEIDRCMSDAICVVTGCTVGRKRLKLVNYGKMAATFVNLESNEAIRIYRAIYIDAPKNAEIKELLANYTDEELFKIEKVKVNIPERDLPGNLQRVVECVRCHEKIMDFRDVEKDGVSLCSACASDCYYEKI